MALIAQCGANGSRNGVHLSIGKIRLFAGVLPSSIYKVTGSGMDQQFISWRDDFSPKTFSFSVDEKC